MKILARLGLVVLAVIILAAACALSYEAGRTPTVATSSGLVFKPLSGNWTSSDVPLKTCTSSYGISGQPSNPAAKQLRLTRASTVANELTFYTDAKYNLTPVLGPSGWNCFASEDADGTSSISIYPPGVRDPGAAANGTEETMGVEETQIPACVGCIADLVCPVFLNAETQLGYTSQYCPGYVPSSESVRFLDGNAETDFGVAVLSDPPGSRGTVTLSGGDYPAMGALLYVRGGTPNSQASGGKVSCVLPRRYSALCSAIINDFVSRTGGGV